MTMDPATPIGIGAAATVALHWMGKTAYEVVKNKSANGAVKAALNAGDQGPEASTGVVGYTLAWAGPNASIL